MTGGKIRSSVPCGQIPNPHNALPVYQKALTGVFVGAVFHRLTCRFIGHCLQTWLTRFILLHNLTSQEHRAQLNTLWIVGTPPMIIIPRINQNVSAQ